MERQEEHGEPVSRQACIVIYDGACRWGLRFPAIQWLVSSGYRSIARHRYRWCDGGKVTSPSENTNRSSSC